MVTKIFLNLDLLCDIYVYDSKFTEMLRGLAAGSLILIFQKCKLYSTQTQVKGGYTVEEQQSIKRKLKRTSCEYLIISFSGLVKLYRSG